MNNPEIHRKGFSELGGEGAVREGLLEGSEHDKVICATLAQGKGKGSPGGPSLLCCK